MVEMAWMVAAGLGLAALVVAVLALLRGRGDTTGAAIEAMAAAQAQLTGRLAQLAESQAAAQSQLADRLQGQERSLAKTVEERLAEMAKRLDDGVQQASHRQATSLHELRERLAVIDAAQKNITELSAQVVSLQDILSNKQARGAFGEIQLNDIVTAMLPPSAYRFQAALGDGRRVDCLLDLPNPPGSIAIDAKFPLESFHLLRNAKDDAERTLAGRAFATAILKHVRDIAEKYIVPGQTAESALMFLPSEAIYAELHANFPDVVEKSFRAKVWIVSPTTLMATLNTVRAVLKDARMREQAGLIQKEVRMLLDDIGRLDDRVAALDKHFGQASEDIRQIRISTEKVAKRADRIETVQLGEDADGPAAEVAPPAPKLLDS
ncbi:DNA recombination protein RmuC [Magnetospirillum moscoviense]|uniref:DNA recombination protein RmuC homolog n=1 Tax=Magnetospirillum moscoviense TaxID=1437059 RepID=A0A178MAI8_9PROT|nr:DNA recombination protein RmuC [Magnetospirillum moscoviense]OAN45790.1 recombinase RmuC [Magnetospirillum moscoviense]